MCVVGLAGIVRSFQPQVKSEARASETLALSCPLPHCALGGLPPGGSGGWSGCGGWGGECGGAGMGGWLMPVSVLGRGAAAMVADGCCASRARIFLISASLRSISS